ncbi:MAG: GNAT family N-acetyltransferase [Planctomycetota bacterium]
MELTWNSENPARWDAPKQRIIGSAPAGIFDSRFTELTTGAPLSGDWWRIDADGKPVGYAWLDAVWGDAEITVAVDESAREKGIGTYTLDNLERVAREKGLNRLYNTVRPNHPDRAKVSSWFEKRGYSASADGSLMRAVATRG